jgi:glycyl-tRNA synthetase
MKKQNIDALINLCARRAIILPAFSIYGDIGGFYDYGPIGTKIRNNIVNLWRSTFIDGMGNLEVDTTIVAPSQVFEASGHLKNFSDPIIVCAKCKTSFRADKLLDELYEKKGDKAAISSIKGANFSRLAELIKKEGIKCEKCGDKLTGEIQNFNLMLNTKIGPTGDLVGYLRPETAQGIFMNFKSIFRAGGIKLPIAVGQVGRAFRNEISPRRMLIRMREFSQMELEYFLDPDQKELIINNRKIDMAHVMKTKLNFLSADAKEGEEYVVLTIGECLEKKYIPNEFFGYLLHVQKQFCLDLGFAETDFRFRQVLPAELPHYSKGNVDLEAKFEGGYEEIAGNAYRTDFDLRSHEKHSKSDMSVINDEKKIVPHVIELSFGLDRVFWTLLHNSLYMEEERGWEVLQLGEKTSPYKYALFPLQKDEKLIQRALEIGDSLTKKGITYQYNYSGSIGKRYARADEVGIPKAITVDFQTLEDGTVTVRDSTTAKQERVDAGKIG